METTNTHSLFDGQRVFMNQIKSWNEDYKIQHGHSRRFYCFTMGCQMNAHDSEKIIGTLTEMGYEPAEKEEYADFVIYNTCCIRENAEQKVYGKLGWLKNLKKKNPQMLIALCGCMTQQDVVLEKLHKSYGFVDIIFGTFNLYKLPELLATRLESGSAVCDIWKEHKEIVEDMPAIRGHQYKASVNIMFGCNNFCTYCIVPYVRGRERSRQPEDILEEVKALAADGVKEITLLGQNVNSYGKTLDNPVSFAKLLRMVNKVDGIERIRFMTSHPKDLSDELIDAMAECEKVCHAIHLPVQSGSSRILKRMNRRYTKEQYLSLVEKIKNKIPDITISTDIIVGFPGETEEDFLDTLDMVRQVQYAMAFTFIYSKRTGTPAAAMEDQVPQEIIDNRFQRLLDTVNPMIHQANEKLVGNIYPVLVEEVSRHQKTILTGRTEGNALVHFEGPAEWIGKTIPVKITENKTFYVLGERCGEHDHI